MNLSPTIRNPENIQIAAVMITAAMIAVALPHAAWPAIGRLIVWAGVLVAAIATVAAARLVCAVGRSSGRAGGLFRWAVMLAYPATTAVFSVYLAQNLGMPGLAIVYMLIVGCVVGMFTVFIEAFVGGTGDDAPWGAQAVIVAGIVIAQVLSSGLVINLAEKASG